GDAQAVARWGVGIARPADSHQRKERKEKREKNLSLRPLRSLRWTRILIAAGTPLPRGLTHFPFSRPPCASARGTRPPPVPANPVPARILRGRRNTDPARRAHRDAARKRERVRGDIPRRASTVAAACAGS